MTDVSPATVLYLATGTTARHHGLDTGRIEPGRPADLTLMGAPKGSGAETALESLESGTYPPIATVLVDGEVRVDGSRNTAPPKQMTTIEHT